MILNSDLTLNTTNTGTLTLTGVISGTGGITKTGTGTATVNGVSTTLNSYTGETSVSQGTLILQTNHNASNSFAWASSAFNINGASILQIGGKRFDFGGWSPTKSINFDSTGGGTLHLTVNGLGGFQNTGNLSINTNGGSQNLITSASSQGLNLGGSGSKLTFNVVQGSNTTSDLNISSVIFNSGSIIKSGSGTLELSTNSNSMSGTTTINGGKLLVSNTSGSATGSGAVIVANGGTLTGGGTTAGASGKISGNVTVQSGGQIAPGNGTSVPGIINLGGNLTLNSGATASFQFNSASPGTGYSQINMTGGGSLNLGNSILEVKLAAGFTPSQSDVFTIINSGPGTSVFSNVVTDGNGRTYVSVYGIGEFDVTYGATSVQLSNYVVPEPTTLMTLGAAGLGLFHFARRRLRKASRVGEGEQQGTQAV
ncbi:MAG: autotransporter-associated beta strand repeat-containing protein [Gemmataceae bacterium]